jgi:cysteine-rich repeat protein
MSRKPALAIAAALLSLTACSGHMWPPDDASLGDADVELDGGADAELDADGDGTCDNAYCAAACVEDGHPGGACGLEACECFPPDVCDGDSCDVECAALGYPGGACDATGSCECLQLAAVCGTGGCEAGEDCANCPADCGSCPPLPAACGTGGCEAGEDCASCPADCGACPVTCGDGVVQPGEACDDGNAVDVDLCNNRCDTPRPAPGPLAAFFSVPTVAGSDSSMLNELSRLVQMAAPGSQIHLSMYEWTNMDFANLLVAAATDPGRGVDVRVVLDGSHPDADIVAALEAGLGADHVHRCIHADCSACIGDQINHNKFFLFTALTDGSTNVVVQSSANLNGGIISRHNNLVIIRGDRTLYDFYLSYWNDLSAGVRNMDYYRSITGDGGTKAYFFPRASGDTILSVIENIHCDAGATVRVAMAFFTDGRDEVATALANKHREGCDVQVIIGTYDASPGADVMDALDGAGVPVSVAPDGDRNVHSKYMIIDARYGEGATVEHLVFTGSHNYTGPALRRNDEALIRVADADIYQAFWDNWQAIRAQLP